GPHPGRKLPAPRAPSRPAQSLPQSAALSARLPQAVAPRGTLVPGGAGGGQRRPRQAERLLRGGLGRPGRPLRARRPRPFARAERPPWPAPAPASSATLASPAPKLNPPYPPGPAPLGMVWIPGGTFWMGCDRNEMSDARPWHLAYVDGFWMDRTEVTNEEFAR